jgi:anti-anti-sigma regulatory factor
MLRITIHDKPELLTFQLEGKLAGAWVMEIDECRQRILAGSCRRPFRFDLAGVTFIDAVGKAYLADMHRNGVELFAVDCLTKAIVAEITRAPIPAAGARSAKAKAKRN